MLNQVEPKNKRSRIIHILRWAIIFTIPCALILSTLQGDKNYGLLSVILIILAMGPFFLSFERRRPEARELVVIAVMAGIAALGRVAFAPIPHFKPTSAVVIITALTFGPEAGFLTGAVAAITSNLFFGQGPWTPWQMFCWGMIGLVAGMLRNVGWLKNRLSLAVFGFATGFGFGWVMNIWYIVGFIKPITYQAIIAAYISSFWFDFTHALSTLIFLVILAKPWIKKLERIKIKFGLMNND
ncbi:ECF transporter S component [Desulfosporosinus hippei]|uniref:Energy-coupling factor transport system substrate-specific component n=1 Tax=Desulfosporosinus hippei DSM 8344 TaxID=1121419 RepID=A0A1G7T5M5_9FIRM|nr:ECF transporter S component [Desulfosporosinus hippei]SDG30623.1 energy-coupling factor transport system substrate-specific component [Desulfosporosinus hippei DSM 8344]